MSKVKCERCGFGRWRPIAYGLPGPEMVASAERGKIEGGCVVMDGKPERRCRVCRLAEGQPPDWTGIDGPRTGGFAEFHRVLSKGLLDAATEPSGINSLALSFDAYAAFNTGEVTRIFGAAERRFRRSRRLSENLAILRGCLFMEQRGCHHRGDTIGGPYVEALIAALRQAISQSS